MTELIEANTEELLDAFCSASGEWSLSRDVMIRQKADAHWMAISPSGEVKARCSLWWSNAPTLDGRKIGLIGHYASGCPDAAQSLLTKGREQLALRGCAVAVGPIDGSTWQRYRFVTERGSHPRFFLEPDNADCWPRHFERSGFRKIAVYSSAVNDNLAQRDERVAIVHERLHSRGLCIRPLNMSEFREELSRIYSIALISFRKNFLYTPTGEEDFIAQYEQAKSFIDPRLCLIAELDGRAVGFLFALPDAMQAARGRAIDTVIIKTVAVLPERECAGLGCLLVDRCHEVARELGYLRAIHALMHDSNNSLNISRRSARVIRRYALFSCDLVAQAVSLRNKVFERIKRR